MPDSAENTTHAWVAKLLQAPHRVYWVANKLQLLVGVALLVLGAVSGQRLIPVLLQGESAIGTIVGHQQVIWTSSSSTGSQHHSPFMPIVEFSYQDAVYRFQDVVGSNSNGGQGDKVTVLVHRQRPAESVIARGVMNWIPWAPMLLVGVLLLGAGSVGLGRYRWNPKE